MKTIITNDKEQYESPAILDIKPVSVAVKGYSGDDNGGEDTILDD